MGELVDIRLGAAGTLELGQTEGSNEGAALPRVTGAEIDNDGSELVGLLLGINVGI